MNRQVVSYTRLDKQCIDNLRRIFELLELYLHQAGGAAGFPSDLEVIALMAKDPKPVICPADKLIGNSREPGRFRTSYEIVNNPLDSKLSRVAPGRIAIIAEKRANHNGSRFVLFYDGSIRAFNHPQFARLKNNAFVAPAEERGKKKTV
jgi:hypothetical protein